MNEVQPTFNSDEVREKWRRLYEEYWNLNELIQFPRGRLETRPDDDQYLELLQETLEKAMVEFPTKTGRERPDLVFYIAGIDMFGGDSMGGHDSRVTIEGMKRRDELVLEFFKSRGIPITVSIPQGYARNRDDTREIMTNTVRTVLKYHKKYSRVPEIQDV